MGNCITGWLPDPENWHLWPDLVGLLDMAATRGNVPAWCPGDLAWIAIDGGEVIGAVSSRMCSDGTAELKHIAGIRVRSWYPALEQMICEWAKGCGAPVIVSRGRRGWIPLVSKLGWKVVGSEDGLTLFEKAL